MKIMKVIFWVVAAVSVAFTGYGFVTDIGGAGVYIIGPADTSKMIALGFTLTAASLIVCAVLLALIKEHKDGDH